MSVCRYRVNVFVVALFVVAVRCSVAFFFGSRESPLLRRPLRVGHEIWQHNRFSYLSSQLEQC